MGFSKDKKEWLISGSLYQYGRHIGDFRNAGGMGDSGWYYRVGDETKEHKVKSMGSARKALEHYAWRVIKPTVSP